MRTLTDEFVVIQKAGVEYNSSDLPGLIAPPAASEADVVYGVRQYDGAARGVSGWCAWDRTPG